MAKRRGAGLGLIAVPLIFTNNLSADKTRAAAARVPANGRIWDVIPVYGISTHAGGGGDAAVTDLDLKIKNTTKTDDPVLFDETGGEHAIIDSSADVEDAPAILDAQRGVTEGDILELDVNVTGGTNPVISGYGYVVLIELNK